ncbi:MAG: DNA starvation/stationary phase protection protein [Leptospiraceae bacterium]|nr:DNA starvation/stationary phase protection protein [Leptospiraceae bacterium]MDW7976969.1 Dps family protein [Leptospiraceae bacterium]
MKKINIGIKEESREKVVEILKRLLADTYFLYFKTHSYHWNVTGPMFQQLHDMFMQQYTELWNTIDLIAERIRSLGEYAPYSYSELAKLTTIKEDEGVPKAEKMVQNLVEDHEKVIRYIRENFAIVEESNDEATIDLLTQRLDVHEKTAWMLRVILE